MELRNNFKSITLGHLYKTVNDADFLNTKQTKRVNEFLKEFFFDVISLTIISFFTTHINKL